MFEVFLSLTILWWALSFILTLGKALTSESEEDEEFAENCVNHFIVSSVVFIGEMFILMVLF